MPNPVLTKQFGEPSAADAALSTPPAPTTTTGSRMTIGSAVQRWYWLFVVVLH